MKAFQGLITAIVISIPIWIIIICMIFFMLKIPEYIELQSSYGLGRTVYAVDSYTSLVNYGNQPRLAPSVVGLV